MSTGRPAATREPPWGAIGAALLVVAFCGVHLLLGWVNVVDTVHDPAGDVTGVYRFWVDLWRSTGTLVGVTTDWVYPIGALVPILAAAALGDGPYLVVWLLLASALDAVAMLLLARRSRVVAWWWLASILLLGPVALSRLDAIAAAIAVIAVLQVARRPAVAALLLTVATWVKVWPAALVVAMVATGRRIRPVLLAVAGTTAAVVLVALAVGAGARVLSFVSAQASRGLQIEAPVALPWLWSRALGLDGTEVYYDTQILTYQIRGDGVAATAAAMTPVLALGVLAVLVAAVVARTRGADPALLLALTALGLVSAVIALNKVGSPQYVTWYAAPVVLGLLVAGRGFRFPAVAVLVIAGLTQLVYPWSYGAVTGTQVWAIALLTVRNLLELVLLGWSVAGLAALRRPLVLRTGAVAPPGRAGGFPVRGRARRG